MEILVSSGPPAVHRSGPFSIRAETRYVWLRLAGLSCSRNISAMGRYGRDCHHPALCPGTRNDLVGNSKRSIQNLVLGGIEKQAARGTLLHTGSQESHAQQPPAEQALDTRPR